MKLRKWKNATVVKYSNKRVIVQTVDDKHLIVSFTKLLSESNPLENPSFYQVRGKVSDFGFKLTNEGAKALLSALEYELGQKSCNIMKAKVKSGEHLLFMKGFSNNWENLNTEMIINFADRYTYRSFKQVKNHLLIDTINGEVDIVFTGDTPIDTPILLLDFYEKDQLVLKLTINEIN